jgi:hypothetical protein
MEAENTVSVQEQTPPRQKNAKRKTRDSDEKSSAAKRTRSDDTGAFFARQKRYDKKIMTKAKKYERPGLPVSFKVRIFLKSNRSPKFFPAHVLITFGVHIVGH